MNGNTIFSASTLSVTYTPPMLPVYMGVRQQPPGYIEAVNNWGTLFGATFVSIDETQKIAFWVAFCLVTQSSATFTAPASGITVVGNGASGVTVAGTSLSTTQAQAFVTAVGTYCVTYL